MKDLISRMRELADIGGHVEVLHVGGCHEVDVREDGILDVLNMTLWAFCESPISDAGAISIIADVRRSRRGIVEVPTVRHALMSEVREYGNSEVLRRIGFMV